MKTVAIITSRWASTRLPGKALVDIGGKPMLQHIVDTARQAKVDEVVVATSVNSQPIIDYCEENKISCYAGSEDDILDRLYSVAFFIKADIIVRLWGDCPLISARRINKAIQMFQSSLTSYNYLTCSDNTGAIAIMPFDLIKDAWINIRDSGHRHWIHTLLSKQGILSVDTQEDLERVREIYASQGTN